MEEYKVVVLGAAGVGKTSLIQRYVHDVFDVQLPQQTMQEEEKIINYRSRQVKLKICDMAGKEVEVNAPSCSFSSSRLLLSVCLSLSLSPFFLPLPPPPPTFSLTCPTY